jgi:spermidine/putrescine transport system substrate-binding protein
MANDHGLPPWVSARSTRRALLRRGAGVAGAGYLGILLAACGDDDEGGSSSAAAPPASSEAPATSAPATSEAATTEAATEAATSEAATTEAATTEAATTEAATTAAQELSGSITMMNYPGWMGKTTVADFKAATGVDVKEVEGLTSGVSAAAAQIAQNRDEYDMSLGGPVLAEQLDAGGLLEMVDFANIPNVSNVDQHFRDAYPWGIPTDFGKTGFAYRKDLIEEQPASWADFWALTKKYSGKVTVLDFDVDVLGIGLLYKGYSVNSADEKELEEARDALIELKKDLQAFLPTDFTKPLIQGTAVMAASYDYDIAAAQKENENIVWVAPTEGMPAYLDGWLAVKGTEKKAEVEAFMNFLLEPENYANFVNGIGASYVMPAAEEFIDPAITGNPSLAYDPESIQSVEFEAFLGEDATKIRNRVWQEVKNA